MGCLFPCFRKKKKPTEGEESLISDGIVTHGEESKMTDEEEFSRATGDEAQLVPIKNENDKISYPQKISVTDFHFLKVLGKGSFGKVLLVEKKDTGTFYAMKILRKDAVAKRNQKFHTKAERQILETLNSPFIVKLHYAFQTKDKLYLVMDFMNGGELFFHLRRDRKFNQERAKFYAAEIILALEYIHSKGVIYRDLKPENILIDLEGHIRLTDFGLSKQGVGGNVKAYTLCGTPEYLAPEILQGFGHDKAVDYWSLGALLYEMLGGMPPFYSKDKAQMFRNILEKPIEMKPEFSREACSLLSGLLVVQPNKRMSNPKEIKRHEFFRGINWDKLAKKELPAPFKPVVNDIKDLRYFDKMFTDESLNETPIMSQMTGTHGDTYKSFTYHGFTYNNNGQIDDSPRD